MLRWKNRREFYSSKCRKEYDEKPYYWTTFCYYKGLITDTGCPHTAYESAGFIYEIKLNVKAVLLIHYHEYHSGGACLLKDKFNVKVFALKSL